MKHCKNLFPFALGTTSYILRAKKNNLLTNVVYLKDYFEIIQLLFLGKEYLADVMSPDILQRLGEIKQKSPVSFIIHLPLDLTLLGTCGWTIQASCNVIQTIIRKTESLGIYKYILHVDGYQNPCCQPAVRKHKIRLRFKNVLKILAQQLQYDTSKIAIENTDYDLTHYDDVIKKYNYSVCMDVGHLVRYNNNIEQFINTFSDRIKVIHLHGYKNKQDHRSLEAIEFNILKKIVKFAKDYKPVLIIEVFNKKDLKASIKHLIKNMKEVRTS